MLILAAVIAHLAAAADPVRGLDARLARPRARLDRARARPAHRHRAVRAALRPQPRLADRRGRRASTATSTRPAVIGFMAAARMLDPRAATRCCARRSRCCTCPALAVLALYPLAPPHWVAGMPYRRRPAGAPERAPQRDRGGGQPALRRPGHDRGGRALAAPARRARLADGALPAARVRRHPRHGQPLRPRHARRSGLRGGRASPPRAPSTGRSARALRARDWTRVALAGTGFGLLAFLINGGFIGGLL